MEFDFSFDDQSARLTPKAKRAGGLSRLFGGAAPASLDRIDPTDRDVALALGDLHAIEAQHPGNIAILANRIEMTHAGLAMVEPATAAVLGLPPLVDLVLQTDAEGIVGSPHFRLDCAWTDKGRTVCPKRTGAILETARGLQRIPGWMLDAIDIASGFDADSEDADHWEALARFRAALEPDRQSEHDSTSARARMTEFLSGLNVRLADSFAISPKDGKGGHLDFDPVPFSSDNLDGEQPGEITEDNSELHEQNLSTFQQSFSRRGALPAYKTGDKSYLVVTRQGRVTLGVMSEKKRAPASERSRFVQNPRPAIAEAVEADLMDRGVLDGLSDAEQQETVDRIATPSFVETAEFSARVVGIGAWTPPDLGTGNMETTVWMPEGFNKALVEKIAAMETPELRKLNDRMQQAQASGQTSIDLDGHTVPVAPATVKAVKDLHDIRSAQGSDGAVIDAEGPPDPVPSGPIVIESRQNFDEIKWNPDRTKRGCVIATTLPVTIKTSMKAHQDIALQWAISAWAAGLPGVLNADEQGLGKTLQTIAFLVWLKNNMAAAAPASRKPILVVAPTTLLENWEAEIAKHVEGDGLGHLMRLYGSALAEFRRTGTRGRDTQGGIDKLNFDPLHEAIDEGRGDRVWILTTYTTLTNYQHSFGKIPFACAVFDEIQAIKNPATLGAAAVRAMNADFRIGLTGTPIENTTADLWALMDQLAPGALGSLQDFRAAFGQADETNMARLHDLVFKPQSDRSGTQVPALAIRRLKSEVARDLPSKTRYLHPRLMPEIQASIYDTARLQLQESGRGAALKILHHIRSVSVHPNLESNENADQFILSSARLEATFAILDRVRQGGERALVFVEHLKMQYRFIELVKQRYGLARVDVINGKTPIKQRQIIVNRFQQHLQTNDGFDLLVLSPKAAGTGLTLTAATHVIHLSRWWNPAVEEQCNDRVHRIGQTRKISVHVPLAIHPGYREGSFDCLLHSLMQRKRSLASAALWPMGDTRGDEGNLQGELLAGVAASNGDPLRSTMAALFQRDGHRVPAPDASGAFEFS